MPGKTQPTRGGRPARPPRSKARASPREGDGGLCVATAYDTISAAEGALARARAFHAGPLKVSACLKCKQFHIKRAN